MFGSSDLGINHCSFFEYIEIVLVLLGQFQIFKNALEQFITNRPPKHVITITTQQTFVGLQDMFWRRLQHVFSVTILCLPRSLQDVFNCYAEDVFKASWRHILKTSARRLGDKQNVYWGCLYLTDLHAYLTNLHFNKSISGKSKANPKCIK